MKLKFFTTFLFIIGILLLQAAATDLFFSEYVEGSSQNKALEIFNGTDEDVNLNNYRIASSTNGDGWTEDYYTFPTDAVLATGDVWVIVNQGSAEALTSQADDLTGFPGIASFTGNDARGLEKLEGESWVLIDLIGDPDEDVTGWEVGGVAEATKDHTIIRNEDIGQGSTDWNLSASTQWTVYEIDSYGDIGSHTFNGGVDVTAPLLMGGSATSATVVVINFNEALDETTATNLNNYSISPEIEISAAVLNLNKVTLTTSEQTGDEEYFITINNVEDLAGNQIAANSVMQFTGYAGVQYDTIADIQNNFNEYEGEQVTIHGIVMIGDNLLYPGHTKIYVQDESGRGIQVFDFDPPSENRQRGDEVVVTGSIELYTGSSGDYYDVQLSGEDIEILSSGNDLYPPILLDENYPLEYNGTWGYVYGEIVDIWDQGTFIKIEIKFSEDLSVSAMFWDSIGANLSSYELGDIVSAQGAITYYRGDVQLLAGYQEDIGFSSIVFAKALSRNEVEVLFADDVDEDSASNLDNYVITPELSVESAEVSGSRVILTTGDQIENEQYVIGISNVKNVNGDYIMIDNEVTFNGFVSYKIQAALDVEAKPFSPRMGQNIKIEAKTGIGHKMILRIYNAEGKLVATPVNEINNSGDAQYIYYWDGKDKHGHILPIGMYICHLEVIEVSSGRKKTATAPIVIATKLK